MRRFRPSLAVWLAGSVAVGLAASSPSPSRAQQVSVSLDRFQELWDQAHPKPPDPPVPTAPLAVESAQIRIAIGQDSARLSTELTLVLDPAKPNDEQILALPGLGHVLSVAAIGCQAAIDSPPGGAQQGPVFLRLQGSGRHVVTVESALPVPVDPNAEAPERTLDAIWPAAAWAGGSIVGGSGVQRIEAIDGGEVREDGAGRWLLVGDPGQRLRLRLYGKAAAAEPVAEEPLSFDVDTASALAVSRARRRVTSFLDVYVRNGRPEALERLRIPVPDGYEVLSASGERVADWDEKDGVLAIELRRRALWNFGVQVQLTADSAPEVDAPVLVPEGARIVRAARKVAVHANDGLLEPLGTQPLARLRADQLGAFAAAFREAPGEPLRAEPGQPSPLWRVTWATGGDVLTGQIDRLVVDVLVGEAGTAHYQLWAEARNGEEALSLALPAGVRLLAARRDGVEVTPGHLPGGTAGVEQWAVPMFVRETAQVAYLETLLPTPFPVQGGRLSVPLPRLGVPASQVEVRLAVPPGFTYAFAELGRAGRVSPPPGGVGAPSPRASSTAFLTAPPGFSVLEASWSGWSKEPPPLVIDVKPLAPSRSDR